MKGVLFSMEGIQKGYLFYQKWFIKGYGFGPQDGVSLYKTLLSAPRPLPGLTCARIWCMPGQHFHN